MNEPKRQHWSSTLGFIFATTGAAVGLGNIWRFPYEVGQHGGSAFVLTYIIAMILISIPLMMTEILLGRIAQANPVDALKSLATQYQANRFWKMLGWWGISCLFLILSFYSVVGSWGIAYLVALFSGKLSGYSVYFFQTHWQHFTQHWPQMIAFNSLFLALTLVVVAQGIQKGLERASKIMMPLLFFLLIILTWWGNNLPGFHRALHFLFSFDVHKLNANVILFALGQAFFSSAIGAGCLLAYGSYLPEKTAIPQSVGIITFCNIGVALLSGLAIFPILFSENIPPMQGPGLMFIALPASLSHMPYGHLFSMIFFVLLIFAAWTSSISLAEPLVMLACERLGLSRLKAVIGLGAAAWLVGLASVFSFNRWKTALWFGHTIFSAMTDFTTNVMLPLGGLGFACFVAWHIPEHVLQEKLPLRFASGARLFKIWLRYGTTGLLLLILFSPILAR
jgi:neurotransmitter:Na+ symporter, NSS family